MPSHALTLSDHLSIDSIKEGIVDLPMINAFSLLLLESSQIFHAPRISRLRIKLGKAAQALQGWQLQLLIGSVM
jgi:hypothetical protein